MAEKKLKYSLDPIAASITITQAQEGEGVPDTVKVIELNASLRDVSRRLALMGLTQHLQRATTRDKESDPLAVIDAAYLDLQTNGLEAFKRKMPVNTAPKGPTKAQCISALAVMYNTTTANIKVKIKDKTKEEVTALLSNPAVLEKVAEMQAAENFDL